MHPVIIEGLEQYLAGAPTRTFSDHMRGCESCRLEVDEIRAVSSLFPLLKNEAPIEVPAGFYARLSQRIELETRSSLWNFLVEPLFARRVAFASLMLLLGLGTFLATSETGFRLGPSPEMVMAMENEPAQNLPDRDMMLVTLASFEP